MPLDQLRSHTASHACPNKPAAQLRGWRGWRTRYPLIIRVNSNANHPSPGKATEVWILELCGRHKPATQRHNTPSDRAGFAHTDRPGGAHHLF